MLFGWFIFWGPPSFVIGCLVIWGLVTAARSYAAIDLPTCPACKGNPNPGATKCIHCGEPIPMVPPRRVDQQPGIVIACVLFGVVFGLPALLLLSLVAISAITSPGVPIISRLAGMLFFVALIGLPVGLRILSQRKEREAVEQNWQTPPQPERAKPPIRTRPPLR